MQEVAQYIQTSLEFGTHSLTIADLAATFSMGESKLRQDFKAVYGIPIRAFIIQQRMERVKSLLEKKSSPSRISLACWGMKSCQIFHVILKYQKI